MAYIGRFATVSPGVAIHPRAVIRGLATIYKQDDILVLSPVEGAWITAHRDAQLGVRVVRTLHHGPMAEYEARFEACCEYDPVRIAAYRAAIAKIKTHFGLE